MAEKKFLVDFNLGGNKAKNFRLEDYADNTAPTSNFVGRLIYTTNSTDPDRVEVYTGTGWEQLAYISDAPVLDQDLVDIAALTGDGVLVRQSGTWAMDNTNYVTLSGTQNLTNKTYEDAILKDRISFTNNDDEETMYIEHSYTGTTRFVAADDISIRSTGGDLILYPGNDDGGTGRAYVHWGNDATTAGIGNEIVTRAATQILTNKTINDTLYFTNPSTIPNDGSITVNDTNENFEITALNGDLVLGATNNVVTKAVVLNGTAGEFLNDPTDADNQIATVGDLSTGYQPLDTDLTNIAALTGTAGFLTTDGANNWSVDTNTYLTVAVESLSNTDSNLSISTSTGAVTIDLATDITVGGDLTVTGDLTVNGDITTLNTATMNVEDNIFVLNSNVTGTPTLDAGLEVERGNYTNARFYWKEPLNLWYVDTVKDSTAAAVSHSVARKYAESLSDPSPQTSYVITHSLNTRDVIAQVYTVASPYEQVETSIEYTSLDTITLTFNTANTGDYRVVVTG